MGALILFYELMAVVPPGVYFIVRNKCGEKVLGINDNGEVTTTTNKAARGWEGIRIENAGQVGVYFLTRHKSNGSVILATNDQGVPCTTGNRVAAGWEGFCIENSNVDGVFYLVRNKDKRHVLACADNGKVCCTTNKAAAGWEGCRLEYAGQF